MRGLYAIVDVCSLERARLEPLAFAEAVLSARPAALQLRDKSASRGGRRMFELLVELAPMCQRHDVPLFANDRADLAALSGCDGVHVGQRDLPPRIAREVAARGGRGLVGISAHSRSEVERAIAERPDYIAIGPVFATASKEAADPTVGLDRLAELAARVREAGIPVVAIGGIDSSRIAAVKAHCCAAAVIAALVPPDEGDRYARVAERALALQRAIASS